MNMQNYTTPFANTGDREEFSIGTDPSGKVSLEKGWTELYQLKPEEGGLFILRKVFNQMMKLVSTDTVTWKTQSFPNWIDDKGDGLPFAYPKNAIVKYTDENIYVSLVNNNTQIPTGANWKLFDITSSDNNTVKLTGDQTIAGVKTFSASPIVPTPTTGTQAVNKDYVDSKTGVAFVANDSRVKTALNATGNAPIYACRAWVNFNGTGTVAIRASGNVSSITDNGTGSYTANIITPLPLANISATAASSVNYSDNFANARNSNADILSINTTKIKIATVINLSEKIDITGICISVFG